MPTILSTIAAAAVGYVTRPWPKQRKQILAVTVFLLLLLFFICLQLHSCHNEDMHAREKP